MYCSNVRMGNWSEDIFLAEEKMKLYILKRDRGELLIQHLTKVFANVLKDVELAEPCEFITSGSCIQLQTADILVSKLGAAADENEPLVIAGTINERDVDKIHHLTDRSRLVCSSALHPCVRNTLIPKPADCSNSHGQNILFGQDIILQLAESSQDPLYMRAEPPLVDGPHGPMEHIPVELSNKSDGYSKWRVLCLDSNMRLETNGSPLSPFTRVVISHVMTGQCLAVERGVECPNLLGTDCGVSVHTYTDIHRRVSAECQWMFVTKKTSAVMAEKLD